MAASDGPLPSGPPGADAWRRLPDDVWARVVPHLRRALVELDDAVATPDILRLRAAPARRLVAGRSRRAAERLLAEGGPLWVELRGRLGRDRDLAADVAAALVSEPDGPAPPGAAAAPEANDELADALARAKARVKTALAQRDEAHRRADGAEARADAAESQSARLRDELADRDRRIHELEAQLERAAETRRAAVERETRRQAGRLEQLEQDLTSARRALEQERRRSRRAAAETPPAPAAASRRERVAPASPARFVPGRPSRLSPGVTPGTREAVDELLHPGRRLLVDGYNITRRHRDDLDLEGQRGWLIDQLAALAASRGLDVTVVFDGAGEQPTGRRRRGVQVVFTPQGVTADDDLVFQVEALPPDEPVVVATDDRGLRERLAPYRVDVLASGELLWVLR